MSAIDTDKVRKILVISLSNIGDIILTTPVISILREHFPSSCIKVLVGPKGLSLFENCKTVDEVIIFDKHVSWLKQVNFVLKLRKEKFDLVVDLRNTVIPLLIGARFRTSLFVDHSASSMRESG